MVDGDVIFTVLLELVTAWLEDLGALADKVKFSAPIETPRIKVSRT